MPFLSPRRWFQFRLSTWFVLVAILAWAMTCRPYYTFIDGWWKHMDERGSTWSRGPLPISPDEVRMNPQLVWPALALATFLTWKAAWAVIERRRRPSAAPE